MSRRPEHRRADPTDHAAADPAADTADHRVDDSGVHSADRRPGRRERFHERIGRARATRTGRTRSVPTADREPGSTGVRSPWAARHHRRMAGASAGRVRPGRRLLAAAVPVALLPLAALLATPMASAVSAAGSPDDTTASAGNGPGAVRSADAAPAPQAANHAAAGETAGQGDVRAIEYHGYRVEVPASWRVVDLSRRPNACIRYDTPAVYLGHPGDEPDCPAHLVGRTAGLHIEPLDAEAAAHVTPDVRTAVRGSAKAPSTALSRGGRIQVAVEAAGVLVTAAHTPSTEQAVRDILADAELTEGAKPTALADLDAPSATRPAPRQSVVAPGTYTGRGFDACAAPSQSAMDAWRSSSPYQAIGIYISGISRACGQPNLTADWIADQTAAGWHFFPIEVGRQAPCTDYRNRISTDPDTARSQGRDAAEASVEAALALGIGTGSVIYNDIEAYDRGGSCTTAVLTYMDGWTDRLHELGYLSGFYSSAASGVADMVANYNNDAYTRIDHIFFAWWNEVGNTDGGSYIPDDYWADHQRIKQYRGGHNETYGGVTINIDNDYLDVESGEPQAPSCLTSTRDFTAYDTVGAGSSGALVWAAQCLLEEQGYDVGEPDGEFGADTEAAVRDYQTALSLEVDGTVNANTWTALLSAGSTPTIQEGSSGEAVRRLQRALTAALGRTVDIDGIFGPQTDEAVRDYQDTRDLDVDGIVGPNTWGALQAGR